MNRAARVLFLALLVGSSLISAARAEVLAQYDALGAAVNPTAQGWTWNGTGNVTLGGTSLLLNGAGDPAQLFSQVIPANVFEDAWSILGNFRFAGNSQEEFGRMMFVDDGISTWHISFLNTGADSIDGIYNGGDPNGPPLDNTATKIWSEPVDPMFAGGTIQNKPFDGFFDYEIVDIDGRGGVAPVIRVTGVAILPAVATPSRFPNGTIGFGSLNPNETGFLQVAKVVFNGNPNAVPEPSAIALAGIALLGLGRLSRHAKGQ